MSRRWLIIVSLSAHAALGVGIFVTGVWKVERLDYRHRASLTIGAMMPGDTGGGEGDQQEEKKEEPKKDDRRKKKRSDVPAEKKLDTAPAEAAAESTGGGGGGEGPGVGPGIGPGTGGNDGTCDPLTDPNACQAPTAAPPAAACGNGILEAKEQCDDGNLTGGDACSATCTKEEMIVPPSILTGLRISGETQIVPPDTVKTQMLRDGKERTTGSFKVCLDGGGAVRLVARMGKGTAYDAYDDKIIRTIRTWRYRAYTVNGRTTPACSVVTFVYTIR